jgi:hypothetical protein
MVSEQLTSACKIFRVMEIISTSRVFKATIEQRLLKQRSVKVTFDGDDQLRDDREHLSTALLKHVEDALDREEPVRVLLLTDALEEDGQVMVVVKLLDLYLPVDAVLGAVLNGDGEISSVVEATEFGGRDVSLVESASLRLLRCRLVLGLEQAHSAATETLTLFKSG